MKHILLVPVTQLCPAPKLHAGPWVLNLHLLQSVLFFFSIPDLSCPTSHLQSEIPTCGARGMRAWPLSRSSPRYLPFPCTVVQDGRVHLLGQVGSRPRNFLRTGSRGRGWGQGRGRRKGRAGQQEVGAGRGQQGRGSSCRLWLGDGQADSSGVGSAAGLTASSSRSSLSAGCAVAREPASGPAPAVAGRIISKI